MKRGKVLLGIFLLVSLVLGWISYCRFDATERENFLDFKKVAATPIVSALSNDKQALRIVVFSILLPQETIVHYRTIANYLGEKIQRPVILIQRKSYAEMAVLLLNGGADMAFFSSGGYNSFRNVGEMEVLVSQQRMGQPYNQGFLLVAQDSEAKTLSDLRGKTIAFSDPLSYSGYTFLAEMLKEQQETPENFFGRYIYTYNHEKSFRAVATKLVDAAAVTSLIYYRAQQKTPELADAVKIIAVSPPFGAGPVVVGKSVSAAQREALRKSLLTIHEDPKGKAALAGLMIDKYIPANLDYYEQKRGTGFVRIKP
jgi:phosphonate transport system substrate-binding protein